MKRILLAFLLLLFTINSFGQQFAQYNTGTLYDSFENLSQRSFIPDSSRQYASNFFLPNLSVNSFITGNSQVALKSRAFLGNYVTNNLTIGKGKYNRINANLNYYAFMFKAFTSLEGNSEIGVSMQLRSELRGLFTDESVLLFNGPAALPDDHYDNIFNNSGTYQAYHQLGFSYREKIDRKWAVGAKLSLLAGIRYQKIDIKESHIDIDRPSDAALLNMSGRYMLNYVPGGFDGRDYIPNLRNPGASIGVGAGVHTSDGYNLQFNVKDLGFIHWSKRSFTYDFAGIDTITQLSGNRRERNIYEAAKNVSKTNLTTGSFMTPTNGKFEISANRVYWLDYDNQYKFSPTLILSKEIFFPGLTAALVNHLAYKNYTVSLTTAYDNYKILSIGGQFMIKSPNAEFFIGSERLVPTGRTTLAAAGSGSQVYYNGNYTSTDLFFGVSFKFGNIIEHPLNASFVPTENNPGFFKRLYYKIFRRNEGY